MSQLSQWLPFSREPQDYDLAREAMALGWYPTYSRERHYLSCAATQPSLSELWSVVDSDISVVKDRIYPYLLYPWSSLVRTLLLSAPSLSGSIMIPRVRLWPGDGILLIETPEFITWANHKEPYR